MSGGPQSVYASGAPQVDPALFSAGVPVFGICYGFQAMAQALGGVVRRTDTSEFGRTHLEVDEPSPLLAGIPQTLNVWMSHGDSVTQEPAGFGRLAHSLGTPVAAFADTDRGFAGVQWHPEVAHTELGQQVIENFLYNVAGLTPDWTSENFVAEQIAGRLAKDP